MTANAIFLAPVPPGPITVDVDVLRRDLDVVHNQPVFRTESSRGPCGTPVTHVGANAELAAATVRVAPVAVLLPLSVTGAMACSSAAQVGAAPA